MKLTNLTRWGGLAAALGALLFAVVDLIALFGLDFDQRLSEVVTSFAWHLQSTLSLVAGALVMLGLVCLYARRLEAMGTFGLVAFLVAFFGLVLAQGFVWDTSFTVPSIAIAAPELLGSYPPGPFAFGAALSLALANLGLLLFGVAILRDGFYPRTAATLLIVGAGLSGAVGALLSGWPSSGLVQVGVGTDIILEAGIIWLGLALHTESVPLDQPPHDTNRYSPSVGGYVQDHREGEEHQRSRGRGPQEHRPR